MHLLTVTQYIFLGENPFRLHEHTKLLQCVKNEACKNLNKTYYKYQNLLYLTYANIDSTQSIMYSNTFLMLADHKVNFPITKHLHMIVKLDLTKF